ncbi:MAG: TIGR00282 family metallophosphoesterase [Acidobacteria bacterium]|nr:TIGR00282 family metallophosphoesterase [Acidobacteriota bacterium]
MNILFIGDIYASPGRNMVARHLPDLIMLHQVDLVIANAENSAGGFGITAAIARDLFQMGIAVLTTGNHVWDKREVMDLLANEPRILRPANYPDGVPGAGLYIATARDGSQAAVMNLQGRTFMQPIDCPFRKADALLDSIPRDVRIRFVDFHAEVTSEKTAMGWYLNGRVTAVVGTHTHVPTADTRILSGGTAYQTDAGMTGAYESVIGADKEAVLRRFLLGLPVRFENATGNVELHGVLVDADPATGKARRIERIALADPS